MEKKLQKTLKSTYLSTGWNSYFKRHCLSFPQYSTGIYPQGVWINNNPQWIFVDYSQNLVISRVCREYFPQLKKCSCGNYFINL